MTLKHRPLLLGIVSLLVLSGAIAGTGVTVARAAQGQPTVTAVAFTTSQVYGTEGGDQVTITGTNFFNGTSSPAVSQVAFNPDDVVLIGAACTTPPPSPVGCITAVTDTTITATTPTHRAGQVAVAVTTPGGTSSTSNNPGDLLTYKANQPKAASLSTHSGTGGTAITVSPSDLMQEESWYDFATAVTFVPASGPGSQIKVTNPCPQAAGVSAGPQGCFSVVGDLVEVRAPSVPTSDIGTVYDVTVTTANVTSALNPTTDQFTFLRVFDTLDGYGALHAVAGTLTPAPTANLGVNLARGFAPLPGTVNQGYVLDGNGRIHSVGNPAPPVVFSGTFWKGWDIARGFALRADGSSGYVLDGFGGIHAFGGAPPVTPSGYWPNWDIARALILRPDGASGYVLDGFGGLHPFGGAPFLNPTGYWPNWDIAKAMVLLSDGSGGYVLDGFGGLHPFGIAPVVKTTGYWPNWDIANAAVLLPDTASSLTSPAGYVLDGFGGLHPFGVTPPPLVTPSGYWPNWDIARTLGVL